MCICLKMVMKWLYWIEEVSIDFIYFISKNDMWNFVFCCLMLNCFSLRFYIWLSIKNCYCIIKYMKWMLNFNCEVYVFWCIDDVNMVIILLCCCCSWCNCDIMFLFLFYLVYLWSIFVCFIDFVDFISIVKNMFSCCCFISINVSYDIDIMSFFKWKFVSYLVFFIF